METWSKGVFRDTLEDVVALWAAEILLPLDDSSFWILEYISAFACNSDYQATDEEKIEINYHYYFYCCHKTISVAKIDSYTCLCMFWVFFLSFIFALMAQQDFSHRYVRRGCHQRPAGLLLGHQRPRDSFIANFTKKQVYPAFLTHLDFHSRY